MHSAKFLNEKDSSNVLAAVQRYNIHHPVVNDAESGMWEALGIKCWPTLLILGKLSAQLYLLLLRTWWTKTCDCIIYIYLLYLTWGVLNIMVRSAPYVRLL